ncbi:hypothetical protein D3C78_1601360 [compost metagenome]
MLQGGVAQPVLVQEGVEAAPLPDMAEFDARDVVGRRLLLGSHSQHLCSGYVEKLGLRIDEARDQPGTGDPVDLWTFTGNPLHGIPPAWFYRPRVGRPASRQPAKPSIR